MAMIDAAERRGAFVEPSENDLRICRRPTDPIAARRQRNIAVSSMEPLREWARNATDGRRG